MHTDREASLAFAKQQLGSMLQHTNVLNRMRPLSQQSDHRRVVSVTIILPVSTQEAFLRGGVFIRTCHARWQGEALMGDGQGAVLLSEYELQQLLKLER